MKVGCDLHKRDMEAKYASHWKLSSNACSIFRLRGVRQMFGGQIFLEWKEILLLGKALKFGVILQKYSLNLIEIWKSIGKIWEKMQNFRKIF